LLPFVYETHVKIFSLTKLHKVFKVLLDIVIRFASFLVPANNSFDSSLTVAYVDTLRIEVTRDAHSSESEPVKLVDAGVHVQVIRFEIRPRTKVAKERIVAAQDELDAHGTTALITRVVPLDGEHLLKPNPTITQMDLIKSHFLVKPITGKTLRYIIAMRVLDETFKNIGPICNFLGNVCKRRPKVTARTPVVNTLTTDSILLDKRHFHNQISMKRDWKNKLENFQETNIMIDSILSLISKLDHIPDLQLIENTQTLINYLEKPFQVTREIFARVESIEKDSETGTTSSIVLVLMSNTLSSHEISQWIRRVYENYKEEIKNALGDTLYFFDHKHKSESLDPRGLVHSSDDSEKAKAVHHMMKIMSAPRQLNFVKSPFYSNKSFANIFGKEFREVEDRVNFFLNNKSWYDTRGIPYQLGLLLSGVPGSGKTSIIRAIANLTKRHIVNVNFANITTATQLKNLFFSEKLSVYTDSTMSQFQVLTIPLEHRIYVLEEIDAISDIVKQRVDGEVRNEPVPDELTLGEILTVLDGTLEVPGRMVIMTSNRPEILDKALIRPGRIDVSVKFGYAKRDLIAEMYQSFFGFPFLSDMILQLPDEKLTAAEVGKVLFRNFKNPHPELIIQDLLEYSLETRERFTVEYKKMDPVWEPQEELGDRYAKWEP